MPRKAEVRDLVLNLVREGYRKKEIADRLGVHVSTVFKILKEEGIRGSRGFAAMSEEKREKVFEKIREMRLMQVEERSKKLDKLLLDHGPLLISQAARLLGWDKGTVRRYASLFWDKYDRFIIAPFSPSHGCALNNLFKVNEKRLDVISLKGDPRIVDFFTSIIKKPVSAKKARLLSIKLNPVLGRETTEKILRRLAKKKYRNKRVY